MNGVLSPFIHADLSFSIKESPDTGVSLISGHDEADSGVSASILPHPCVDRHLVVIVVCGQVVLQWHCTPLQWTQFSYTPSICICPV